MESECNKKYFLRIQGQGELCLARGKYLPRIGEKIYFFNMSGSDRKEISEPLKHNQTYKVLDIKRFIYRVTDNDILAREGPLLTLEGITE